MRAAAKGQLALVDYLIAQGANVNLADGEGSSALHAAAHMGHLAVAKSLLRASSIADLADNDGDTPLDWASSQAHTEIVELLSGQVFAPLLLRGLLDAPTIERLLDLRQNRDIGPVHDDGAGHEVVFLHGCRAKGLLSEECIRDLDGLADAMRAHDPRCLHDGGEGLAVRCMELHTYHVGGQLMDPDHKDSGSALSMSVCLSDPAQLEGGKFLTWKGPDPNVPVVHECNRGDAVLFRSEDLHNVSCVQKGVRHTLVIELWVGQQNAVDRNR